MVPESMEAGPAQNDRRSLSSQVPEDRLFVLADRSVADDAADLRDIGFQVIEDRRLAQDLPEAGAGGLVLARLQDRIVAVLRPGDGLLVDVDRREPAGQALGDLDPAGAGTAADGDDQRTGHTPPSHPSFPISYSVSSRSYLEIRDGMKGRISVTRRLNSASSISSKGSRS